MDLAYAVAIALVALQWDEWYDFGFFRVVCCGARQCFVVGVGSRVNVCATAVGGGSFALSFFGVVTGGSTAASWRQMQQVFASWSSSSSCAAFRLLVLQFSSGFSTYFFRAALLVLALSLMAVL